METVLLFDIDGTLVRTGGAGKAAVEAALSSHFGVRDLREGSAFSGRTDPDILTEILTLHELEANETNILSFQEAYLTHLPVQLNRLGGSPCPGIRELMTRISHLPLGLLTGNIRRGAETKLRHFQLWDYFRFGGFGDRLTNRDDVARSAYASLRETHGHVPGERIWVIGDTPLDVQCAKAIGARSVAVATGWTPYRELKTCGADITLETLKDHSKLPAEWFKDGV